MNRGHVRSAAGGELQLRAQRLHATTQDLGTCLLEMHWSLSMVSPKDVSRVSQNTALCAGS